MTAAASAQTFELLTPCFCAGVSKNQPEMRIASIRGQLRWWVRVLYGTGKAEYELFGGIKGKAHAYADEGVASSFQFSLTSLPNNPAAEDFCLVPHKQNQNGFWAAALPPRSRYTLEWMPHAHPDFRDMPDELISGQTRLHRFEQVLKAWLLLGTIGRRATRAAGSVWPSGYAPGVDAFNAAVAGLHIPGSVKVAALNTATCNPTETAEELREIADKTVHGLRSGNIFGDPLGYVSGNQRKASPLRFKVGHFADGYRLIAIWDNRNNRGGSLADAKKEMLSSYPDSQLEAWLSAAGF
jgi:hypothetical protein